MPSIHGIGAAAGSIGRSAGAGAFMAAMTSSNIGVGGTVGRALRTAIRARGFRPSAKLPPFGRWVVSGRTRDSTGTTLEFCQVEVYAVGGAFLAATMSDGSGAFSVNLDTNGAVFIVAWKPDTVPALAGVTVYGIQPAPA